MDKILTPPIRKEFKVLTKQMAEVLNFTMTPFEEQYLFLENRTQTYQQIANKMSLDLLNITREMKTQSETDQVILESQQQIEDLDTAQVDLTKVVWSAMGVSLTTVILIGAINVESSCMASFTHLSFNVNDLNKII